MRLTRPLVGIIYAALCSQCAPSESIDAAQLRKVGVFAETSTGLTELTAYALEAPGGNFNPANVTDIPRLNGATTFVVNMPDAQITQSTVYWAASQNSLPEGPLKADIETIQGTVYRITSPALRSRSSGMASLRIKMPAGTPDRMYLLKLGKAALAGSSLVGVWELVVTPAMQPQMEEQKRRVLASGNKWPGLPSLTITEDGEAQMRMFFNPIVIGTITVSGSTVTLLADKESMPFTLSPDGTTLTAGQSSFRKR